MSGFPEQEGQGLHVTFSAFSTSRPAAGFPPRHFQPDSGRGRPGLPHHPFRGLIKCSLYCRDVLRCNLFLSRGFRAKLKVVGLWVLFWFQTSLFRAHSHAEAWARVFGPLVGTGENPNLPFLLLRWAWWPRPHAPLPAGHPSDAGTSARLWTVQPTARHQEA